MNAQAEQIYRELYERAALCRELQRDYFRHRQQKTLEQCKAAERSLDEQLRIVQHFQIHGSLPPTQTTLDL